METTYTSKKPCTGGWVRVDGQIDGGEREVCGVNAGNNRPVDSGSWRHVSPCFKRVSTSGTYDLHALLNTDRKILRCRKPCIGQWISLDHSNNIRFRQCDATANAVAMHNSHSGTIGSLPLLKLCQEERKCMQPAF